MTFEVIRRASHVTREHARVRSAIWGASSGRAGARWQSGAGAGIELGAYTRKGSHNETRANNSRYTCRATPFRTMSARPRETARAILSACLRAQVVSSTTARSHRASDTIGWTGEASRKPYGNLCSDSPLELLSYVVLSSYTLCTLLWIYPTTYKHTGYRIEHLCDNPCETSSINVNDNRLPCPISQDPLDSRPNASAPLCSRFTLHS